MQGKEIVETARKNLTKALADPRIQNLPNPGWRWQTYCINTRKHMGQFTTPQKVIHFAQEPDGNAGYEARMIGQQLKDYTCSKEENYLNQFPDFASYLNSFHDHAISIPETLTSLNGRLVSSPLYNHIQHTMRCLTYNSNPTRVLEIGGGYGAPGRIWMTNGIHQPAQYINVDFPESLFFAQCYLRTTLPDHTIIYLSDKKDFEALENSTNKSIFLCPIAGFETLLQYNIDLIINTGSLQEMSEEYVSFYMRAIAASKCQMFYSSNFFAQPLNQLMESMNLCAPIMDRQWQAVFKHYGHDDTRSVAEILFTRSSGIDSQNIKFQLDDCLRQGMPQNGSEFLELFDLVRKIDDLEYIEKVIRTTVERMPYIPKEVLFLARQAELFGVDIVEKLELIAKESQQGMGGVGTLVSHIRDRLVKDGAAAEFSFLTGSLITHGEGTIVEIDKKVKKLRKNISGSVERIKVEDKGILISGWAMDRDAGEPASMIHIFYDGSLMWSGRPIIQRSEFDVNFPIGFEFGIMLNVSQIDTSQLLILAEFNEDKVDLLANGGSIQIFK